jgi:5-methyltetrahydropteroyltriglutamate--homocysteine methyltransferase
MVLGLVTTKEPEPESADLLVRRIEQAAKYVPMENLAVSTQCGFASAMKMLVPVVPIVGRGDPM